MASSIDIELQAFDLCETVLALAALNGEVSADLTPDEIEVAKSGLIWRALDQSRKLRGLFNGPPAATSEGAAQ